MVRLLLCLLFLSSMAAADEYRLLHFEAEWCVTCKTVSRNLASKEVVAAIKQHKVKLVNIDVDNDPAAAAAYKVKTLPDCMLVRVNNKGEAVVVRREIGTLTPAQLITLLTPPKD